MLYLSQLLNVKIIDSREVFVARLKDVVVFNDGKNYPYVVGIIFQKGKDLYFIKFEHIETLSTAEVTLNKFDCWSVWGENEKFLLLNKDVMDEQIFDVDSIKVVRVNDLHLVKIGDLFNLVGIDVSNKALLRRLGLSSLPFVRFMQVKLIDWHSVNFIQGNVGSIKLKTPFKKLEKLHPADIANLIENLTLHQGSNVVQSLHDEKAAEVLAEIEPKYKDTLLEKINPRNLARILEEMPTDEAADVLQDLSEHKRLLVFKRLSERKAKVLNRLSKYKGNVAGGLMTADYMRIHPQNTIADAVDEIRRKSAEHKFIYHVFVVDESDVLKGVVSIRTLILSDKHLKVVNVMSKILITVKTTTSYENVARLLTKYNLLSVAVVDQQGKIKGIVTIDDVMRLLVPHA